MSIALQWNPTAVRADMVRSGNFVTDEGLEAAVLISLFTDAPARADDVLPTGDTDRRGYWGDAFSDVVGDITGSRLWLLSRSKLTVETLASAEEYAKEALAWLVADGVASRITATAEARQPDIIVLTVAIVRSSNVVWTRTWELRLAA